MPLRSRLTVQRSVSKPNVIAPRRTTSRSSPSVSSSSFRGRPLPTFRYNASLPLARNLATHRETVFLSTPYADETLVIVIPSITASAALSRTVAVRCDPSLMGESYRLPFNFIQSQLDIYFWASHTWFPFPYLLSFLVKEG